MSLPNILIKLFKHVDENRSTYIESLREAVAIPSVSGWEEYQNDTTRMVHWAADRLRKIGVEVSLRNIGTQLLPNGKTIVLPPVLLGTLGNDPNKKTVCIYGHLDVQPGKMRDGWDSQPFVLTEREGKLYGRGATDDKGPILCWIHAIEGYQRINAHLPVNIRLVFEAQEESGNVGLEQLLTNEKDLFLKNVDYVCISDSNWLGKDRPCITYGLRGYCCFYLQLECASQDLHSGSYGGAVYEAMTDLIYLLNTLVDKEGTILITDIYKDVAPLLPEERNLYTKIDFDINEYRKSIGTTKLRHNEDKVTVLMHNWRHPSLSIHGIEGAHAEPGFKTIIPGKVIGKFSIRIVPNQTVEGVSKLVIDFLNKKWDERKVPNKLKVSVKDVGPPWTEDPFNPHYVAAKRAIRHTYNQEPDLIRCGGTIPITITLQKVTGKNVLLLPIGAGDDNPHSQNEKIDVRNYIEGIKLLGAYLYEVSQIVNEK